jgi:hypothetical protein
VQVLNSWPAAEFFAAAHDAMRANFKIAESDWKYQKLMVAWPRTAGRIFRADDRSWR